MSITFKESAPIIHGHSYGRLSCYELRVGNFTAVVSPHGGGQVFQAGVPNFNIFHNNQFAITEAGKHARLGDSTCLLHIGAADERTGMPMHGPFSLATATFETFRKDSNSAQITFLTDKSCIPSEYQNLWPEGLEVYKTVEIKAEDSSHGNNYSLTTTYKCENHSSSPMEFPMMIHNYFNVNPSTSVISAPQFVVHNRARPIYDLVPITQPLKDFEGFVYEGLGKNEVYLMGSNKPRISSSKSEPILCSNLNGGYDLQILSTGLQDTRIWSPIGRVPAIPDLFDPDRFLGIQPSGNIVIPESILSIPTNTVGVTTVSQTIVIVPRLTDLSSHSI